MTPHTTRRRFDRKRIALLILAIVAIAPMVTAACGGNVTAVDDVGKPSVSPQREGTGAGTFATQASSSGLQPCAGDSAPLPLPDSPDPAVLAQCQKLCDRRDTCEGCASETCLPNCLFDGLATRDSGPAYVAWMSCLLAHDAVCGVQPACDAEYCAYTRAGSSTAPVRPECH